MKHTYLKNIVILILCLLSLPSVAFANTYESIKYNLSPAGSGRPVLSVEVLIKGKFSKELVIDLPYKWASASYTEQIKNFKIGSSYTFKIVKQDDHQAIITIPNSTDEIKISYEIHQKSGDPSDVHEVIVRNDLIHATGYGLFAIPSDLNLKDKISISINWLSLDPSWRTMSSYSTERAINQEMSVEELIQAIYVAGKIRLYKMYDVSSPVFLSLYGNFDIKDQKIVSDLEGIISSQRAFFNDFDFPYYAISLIEGDNPESMGGTRLHSSFTAFLPKGMLVTDYYILFAHEHLHNWIGGKIGNSKGKELNYWWTEGFTDYYSRLIAMRSGGIDKETFITEINKFLQNYYLSPVINEPNARIKKDFWNNYDIEKLPYYRGFIFAIYLNNLTQQQDPSSSLDNIMYDLFQKSENQNFSVKSFQNIAKKYIAGGIRGNFANFIDKGRTISLEQINLPLVKTSMGRYHLGFDKEAALESKIIKNIDSKSNAYKAGLRDGQKILGYDIFNDPKSLITIRTTEGVFKFKPEHYDKITVYQLKEKLSINETEQFNRFFGIK